MGSFSILSEEMGFKRNGYPIMVIDPVDGSYNAARGIPFYSVSIAASHGLTLDGVFIGVVHAPELEETYLAVSGEGAYLNSSELRARTVAWGERAVSISSPRLACRETAEAIGRLLCMGFKVRMFGSASLESCFVSSNRLDAYVDPWKRLRPFDIAAAYLIAREAEAIVEVGSKEMGVGVRLEYLTATSREVLNAVKTALKLDYR